MSTRPRQTELQSVLIDAGITFAEYAVLWHVRDTVVQPRNVIAAWTAANLPNVVPAEISTEDCMHAADSLIRRGLLVELTVADIERDLARWRAEKLPVSWGVDRDRHPGDVDLTDAGFRVVESISEQAFPRTKRSPVAGYNDDAHDRIRVFGEMPESCERVVRDVIGRIEQAPWKWPHGSARAESMQPLGPWWYSRFEQIATGFEVVVRRVERPVR